MERDERKVLLAPMRLRVRRHERDLLNEDISEGYPNALFSMVLDHLFSTKRVRTSADEQ